MAKTQLFQLPVEYGVKINLIKKSEISESDQSSSLGPRIAAESGLSALFFTL